MQIKDEMLDAYGKWKAAMQEAKKDNAILCFNYLCEVSEKGMSIFSAVSNVLNAEFRPNSMSDDEVYSAMYAFSIFHKNGDGFRKSWNKVMASDGYADYIERGSKKHLFPPFPCHSIFESHFFKDDDGYGKGK